MTFCNVMFNIEKTATDVFYTAMAKLSYYIAIYYFSTIVRFLSEVAKRYTVNNGVGYST